MFRRNRDEYFEEEDRFARRGCGLPLIIGGLIVLLTLLVGGALGVASSLEAAMTTDPAFAMSPDSIAYASVTLPADPRLLYATARAGSGVNGQREPEWLKKFVSNAKKNGLDVEADVLPWMGRSAGLGIVGPKDLDLSDGTGGASSLGKGKEPEMLLALAVRDERAAQDGVRKMLLAQSKQEGNRSAKIKEATHGKVKVFLAPGKTQGEELAAAVTERTALFANSRSSLGDAIDRLQADKESLGDRKEYKKVLANLPEQRAMWFFVNTGPLLEMAKNRSDRRELQAAGLFQKGLAGIAVSPMDGGHRLDFYSYAPGKQNLQPTGLEGEAGDKLAALAPGNTFLFLAGENLAGWWKQVQKQLDSAMRGSGVGGGQNPFKALEAQSGINLGRDVFGPYTGEYGLAMAPAGGKKSAAEGLLVLLETPKPAAARASLQKLESALGRGQPIFRKKKIAGQEAHVLAGPSGSSVRPGYLLGKDYVALAVSENTLKKVAGKGTKLADNFEFGIATGQLDRRDSGLVYLNMQALLGELLKNDPEERNKMEKSAAGRYVLRLRTVTIGTDTKKNESWGNVILRLNQPEKGR